MVQWREGGREGGGSGLKKLTAETKERQPLGNYPAFILGIVSIKSTKKINDINI